jgi:hypothetical protein
MRVLATHPVFIKGPQEKSQEKLFTDNTRCMPGVSQVLLSMSLYLDFIAPSPGLRQLQMQAYPTLSFLAPLILCTSAAFSCSL